MMKSFLFHMSHKSSNDKVIYLVQQKKILQRQLIFLSLHKNQKWDLLINDNKYIGMCMYLRLYV